VCQLLADLLRKSLAAGNRESVPLAEEVALAKSYLSVEQVRFGERLGVETRVEPAAEGWKVPALVLQPIVENAVTHGVSARLEGGTVRIAALVENGYLVVTIDNPRDPGAPSRPGSGLGLENVRRRLEAVYGRDAEVQVTKGPDRFRVELRLPASPASL
jgi:two-component system, LytTR family, sensor histidine kinase AlgZ